MTELSPNSIGFWQQPWVWLAAVGDLVILDQISKYVVREWMTSPIILVPDWAQFKFVENTGVAFSLPVPGGLAGIIAVVVSLWLGRELWTRQLSLTLRVSYTLIMAGAIGNLIDRVWHGAVTDFIAIGSFPVFNLADSFICVGVAIMVWHEVMSG